MDASSETPTADEPKLTPELLKLDRRVGGLHEQNQLTTRKLSAAGANIDTSNARFEHLCKALVDYGVITMEQLLREQEHWELHLRESLAGIREQLEAMQRGAGQPVVKESGLIIPGAGQKLT